MILEDIIAHKRKEVEELKLRFPLTKVMAGLKSIKERHRSFIRAINNPHKINLIAEIKKASPSAGIIKEQFNALRIAELYELAGVEAISVLTDMHFFKGRTSYLKTVREVSTKPILRKDFIIDRYQIYESALFAADAVLLITSILTQDELKLFIKELKALKITPLVEVHSEEDLKKAIDCGAPAIGINNRDLKTFKVNLKIAEKLIRHVPKEMSVVVESGIETHEEIMRLKSLGFYAFLVGTALMKADNIVDKVKQLKGEHL